MLSKPHHHQVRTCTCSEYSIIGFGLVSLQQLALASAMHRSTTILPALSIFLVLDLIPLVAAIPTSWGVSSTTAMADTSSAPNALAIVIPMVFASFLLLSLAACCCAYRRRSTPQQTTHEMLVSSASSDRRARLQVAHGLGILPSSQAQAIRYQQVPASSRLSDIPPPYTPRSSSPLLEPGSKSPRSPGCSPVPSICVEAPQDDRLITISTPSPLISRTGSPSLQIWSPASPTYSPI